MLKEKVFDIHAHIFPDKIAPKVVAQLNSYYGLTIAGLGTPEHLKAVIEQDGTQGALVFGTATKPTQVESLNTFLAQHIGKPFLCFGSMHPDRQNIEDEVRRMKALGLLGVKLHPDFQGFAIDSPAAMKMFEIFERENMPVLIHTGDKNSDDSSPVRLRRIIDTFPSLRVLAAHLGGYFMWDLAEKELLGHDLFVDTSSSMVFMEPEEAVRLIRLHGADKVCFGTDYPIHTPAQELEFFDRLPLTDEERRMILFDNAFKFLGIDPPDFTNVQR